MKRATLALLIPSFFLALTGCGLDSPFFTNGGSNSAFSHCSGLEFPAGVAWSPSLSNNDRDALKIALSITGSFEGSAGWSNLTSDFDGMGMSLGLLSQSLGAGSLEPLLIKMRDNHRTVLASIFTPAQLSSLLGMLGKWEATKLQPAVMRLPADDVLGIYTAEAANAEAAKWARETLYTGGKFIDAWSVALRTMAETPEYISLQIAAAGSYHDQARTLMKQTSTSQLRAYLTFFDLVIQNGGLLAKDLTDYKTFIEDTPYATEEARLNMAVNLRLRWVKPEYVEDVRSRKFTIIQGRGSVHGETRDLEGQYCFNRQVFYP